jgi:hypothetical protein
VKDGISKGSRIRCFGDQFEIRDGLPDSHSHWMRINEARKILASGLPVRGDRKEIVIVSHKHTLQLRCAAKNLWVSGPAHPVLHCRQQVNTSGAQAGNDVTIKVVISVEAQHQGLLAQGALGFL